MSVRMHAHKHERTDACLPGALGSRRDWRPKAAPNAVCVWCVYVCVCVCVSVCLYVCACFCTGNITGPLQVCNGFAKPAHTSLNMACAWACFVSCLGCKMLFVLSCPFHMRTAFETDAKRAYFTCFQFQFHMRFRFHIRSLRETATKQGCWSPFHVRKSCETKLTWLSPCLFFSHEEVM